MLKLGRVSHLHKDIVDPVVWETVRLAPCGRAPTYRNLCRVLGSVLCPSNYAKISRFTKHLIIPPGWFVDGIDLGESTDHTTSDDEYAWNMLNLETIEGRPGTGGGGDVNTLVAMVVRKTVRLQTFKWESTIPLTTTLLRTLCSCKTLRDLMLDLTQPTRKERNAATQAFEFVSVERYRPSIGVLHRLPLESLSLVNIPARAERWQGEFYKLLAGVRWTLRNLTLLNPAITVQRYPQLFSTSSARKLIKKVRKLAPKPLPPPPCLDLMRFDNAGETHSPVPGKLPALLLKTLGLGGFTLAGPFIHEAVKAGHITSLNLLGCVPEADYECTLELAVNLRVLKIDHHGFYPLAVAMVRFGTSGKSLFVHPSRDPGSVSGIDRKRSKMLKSLVYRGELSSLHTISLPFEFRAAVSRTVLAELLHEYGLIEDVTIPVQTKHWDYFITQARRAKALTKLVGINKGPTGEPIFTTLFPTPGGVECITRAIPGRKTFYTERELYSMAGGFYGIN